MLLAMPQPSRISPPQLLQSARDLLEQAGADGLSMRALARALHVTAPSLYFHVESRTDLLLQLVAIGLRDLEYALREAAARPGDLHQRALAIAHAYVDFATAYPQLFTLMFGPCIDEQRFDPAAGEAAAAPLLELIAEVVPPGETIALASAVWAFVHGYTVLRLADQFRMNPDHESAFEHALIAMIEGARLAATPPAR
jgi:AcrR family transcriptional regulator